MQSVCSQCGAAMVQGTVAPTGVMSGQMELSFIVSAGVQTSLNPIKAVFQGMREEHPYREESCTIRGRVCSGCGRFEFFIDPEDLAKVNGLVGPSPSE